MKRNRILIASTLLLCAAAAPTLAQDRPPTLPALGKAAQAALITALSGKDGEYAARAEYEAILDKFGSNVLPYAHIIRAEQQHIAALERQCRACGIPVPADTYYGKVQPPATLAEAAKAGLLAEEANVRMYDELLKAAEGYPPLVQVFTRLQAASANRHLKALRAAEANGGELTSTFCDQNKGCGRQGGRSPAVGGDGCQQNTPCQPMAHGQPCRHAGRTRSGQP
ncbi:MAG: hypothetical protein U1G07_01880 [Verrucomicrobiota bacterium]